MSELTVHSVCTKGPIYPTLLYFQNGRPTKEFETNCAVLQDKNKSRTIVMEASELVYAGNEEKEDSGKILILARDRISGKVRLIEVDSAYLKPLTKTDLDHLEHQHDVQAKHSKMVSKKNKTLNKLNAQRDTGQTDNLVACNNSIGEVDIQPTDREINRGELDCLQQQHEISSSEFLEFERKKLEQREKLKINVLTAMEPEQTEMEAKKQKNAPVKRGATKVRGVHHKKKLKLPLVLKPHTRLKKPKLNIVKKDFVKRKDYNEIDPDEFYVPFLNREATTLEDVYVIKKIFSEDEYFQIYSEVAEIIYLDDLHPYIQQFVENKTLSLEFTVLAVYASVLLKFLHTSLDEIQTGNSKICQHSKTLNEILLTRFTECVQYEKRKSITRSRAMRNKIVCHIIVCTLILNDFQFEMDSLSDVIERKRKNHEPLPKLVSLVAATIEKGYDGTIVKLKLPLVMHPKNLTELEDNYSEESHIPPVNREASTVRGVYHKKKISSKKQLLKKPRATKIKKDFVQRNDYYEIDPDEFYVPFLNREATNLEDVYVINQIFSDNDYSQIFFELAENNYLDDFHPYIKQFVEKKTLSLEFTVLAVYASVLLKFLHASLDEIETDNSKICQHSKTLYGILLKRFTERVQYEKRSALSRSRAMRNKIVCHIIVCTLIINDFQFEMDSLSDAIKGKTCQEPLRKLVSYVAATIEIGDDKTMVKLKLPLVPKIRASIPKQFAHKMKRDLKKRKEKAEADKNDPDDSCLSAATVVEDVTHIEKNLSEDECVQSVQTSITNEDSEMAMQLKLPLVPKPQGPLRKPKPQDPLRKPKPHKNDKKFVQCKDHYEIDPDEFYVPFLNREATNLEDVYVINQIFSDNEYSQIFFELAEYNYLDDLHRYIKQIVENKTLSLEFTVLAVYASVLLKFLHASLDEIRTGNSKICQHSKTLYEILLKRFTERVQYEKGTKISRSRAMRNKIVCHIIVCTLILNDFQFEMYSLSDVIERKNHEPLPKLVSLVAATIEKGYDGTIVKLKLPLVMHPKNLTELEDNYSEEFHIPPVNREASTVRGVYHKNKISSKKQVVKKPRVTKIKKDFVQRKDYYEIDPDEFYVPFLNREATNLEDVYVINQIFSDNEYSQIFFELAENNYLDDLHRYIKQIVENKTLSLEFTVLAVYASVLLKFLHATPDEIRTGNSKICQHSKTLYEMLLKRFTERVQYEKRTKISRTRAMRNKIVCHIIVCTLILNDFQFEMDSLSDAIKGKNCQEPLRKLVSYVAATIEIGDDKTMVKLKLPLVPKIRASIPKQFAHKMKRDLNKRKEKAEADKNDPDDSCLSAATVVEDVTHIEKNLSEDECVQSVQTSITNEDSEMAMQLKLPLVPKPQGPLRKPKPQDPLRKPKPHKNDKKFVQCEDHYEIDEDEFYCEIDPDEFYVPFLNREATNLEDVYVIKKIFSEDQYSQIFFELGEKNYMDDLHPYIKQFVENKTLSLEFTVLAVYASVLLKFLHASLDEIRTGNSKICQHSKTLYEIILKRFTEQVKYKTRSGLSRSRAMRNKIVCHIIVCTLILNDFQFEMDSLSDAIKGKYCQEPLRKLVSYVAATIEIGDDETMVKLKLPLVPKIRATILRKYAQKIKRNLKKRKEKAGTDKNDPDDSYLPTATEVDDVYHTDKILSEDECVQTSVINEDSETAVQLKLPLVTKTTILRKEAQIIERDLKKRKGGGGEETGTDKIDPDDFYLPTLDREATVLVGAVIDNEDEGSLVELKLPLVPKTRDIINKTSKHHTVDKDLTECNENMVDTDDIIDPDDFYVLPIDRDATELENVYLIDKIFSKSKCEKIYCELEKSDYSEYLHPYIQSMIENQLLSLQLTVLAVYASELIKFIHVPSSQMNKPNFQICHYSKTLNHLIRKRFTELSENKCGRNSKSTSTCRITSLAMKEKLVCHVIVCVLILNNFQCELDPLSDAVKHKKYITDLQEYIRLVGASVVDRDNGKMVQLKLPLVSKTRITRKRCTKIRKTKTAGSSKRRKKR
ncbi:uncharacterized protein LOC134677357 [Cydia fagiglandana]|uniref:uncharacterized protein LOC134677357 n=1 Tax=Cydia fagiglandana TaxID=1458189 RepID=UPI002FEDED8C